MIARTLQLLFVLASLSSTGIFVLGTNLAMNQISMIAYGDGMYVAVGGNYSKPQSANVTLYTTVIGISSDLESWKYCTLDAPSTMQTNAPYQVVFYDAQAKLWHMVPAPLANNSNAAVFSSYDLVTWRPMPLPPLWQPGGEGGPSTFWVGIAPFPANWSNPTGDLSCVGVDSFGNTYAFDVTAGAWRLGLYLNIFSPGLPPSVTGRLQALYTQTGAKAPPQGLVLSGTIFGQGKPVGPMLPMSTGSYGSNFFTIIPFSGLPGTCPGGDGTLGSWNIWGIDSPHLNDTAIAVGECVDGHFPQMNQYYYWLQVNLSDLEVQQIGAMQDQAFDYPLSIRAFDSSRHTLLSTNGGLQVIDVFYSEESKMINVTVTQSQLPPYKITNIYYTDSLFVEERGDLVAWGMNYADPNAWCGGYVISRDGGLSFF